MNRFLTLPAIILAWTIAVAACPGAARAQAAPNPDKYQPLVDEMKEIDMSRSLNPLKLTASQIDKLIKVVDSAKVEYDRRIEEISAASIGKLADDIHKRHKEAMAGAEASKEWDNKAIKALDDFYAKREAVNTDNILTMTGACGQIFTKEQKAIAVQMEKDALFKLTKNNGKNTTDAQYFNLYVVDVFISYPRVVPLLTHIKQALYGN